jgi:glycosyltransferase involved in cell wall biosynthesis
MRVSVDCQAVVGQQTGFGTYLSQLLVALKRVAPPEVVIREVYKVKGGLRTPTRILWDQVGLPFYAAVQRPEVLFIPAFSVPRLWPGKIVATCHDLIGMQFPQYFSHSAQLYWSRLQPQSMRHADQLLTISNATKRDIVRLLNYPESKITVTPLAPKPIFTPARNIDAITRIRRAHNFPRPYCLAVGTIEPRKNIAFLIEAFSTAKRDDQDLVIVGKRGWDWPVVEQRIRQLHLQDRVKILEYVTEDDLVHIYAGATALLFPSRYEGFGLPVLEAMASGIPVIASTASSIPEVGGEAALYANPSDHEEWRQQISRIIGDPKLRADLSQRGIAHARGFTWINTAQRTLEVFNQALKS